MDNITHTIVGLAVGELLHRSVAAEPLPAAQRTRRRLLLTACAAASNLPDLDLVLVHLLPAPLGYLLQHRGHTHTLLLAIPQALLLLALLWLWPAARRLLAASAPARLAVGLAIVGGLLLHIGMDFLNSYGVHPFYPFDMRWRYGDMVFIVEPLFWVGAGVPLLMTMRRPWLRWAWAALLAALLAACVVQGFLHWASWLGLVALGLGLAALGRQRRQASVADARRALLAGLALCLAFVGAQALASAAARSMLAADLAARADRGQLLDAALTAYPANPVCWNFVTVERGSDGQRYRLRRGVLSLAPRLLPVTACPAGLTGALAAAPDRRSQAAAIGLLSDDSASLAALRRRAAGDCYLRAWLRFARMPLLDGDSAADLRFGTRLAANFSAIELDRFKGRACPTYVPPWAMPRADLLRP